MSSFTQAMYKFLPDWTMALYEVLERKRHLSNGRKPAVDSKMRVPPDPLLGVPEDGKCIWSDQAHGGRAPWGYLVGGNEYAHVNPAFSWSPLWGDTNMATKALPS